MSKFQLVNEDKKHLKTSTVVFLHRYVDKKVQICRHF